MVYKEGQKDNENDVVRVGSFLINIEMVTKDQIKRMRKFLPPNEYKLLKNRKTARMCRRKKKEERGQLQQSLHQLTMENQLLKIKLEEIEQRFKESEAKIQMQQ